MSTSPIIEFRLNQSPYSVISTSLFGQSTAGGNFLPMGAGEVSEKVNFRIYNNYSLASGIASALNIQVSVFDTLTASVPVVASPASQSWIKIWQTGYGESTGAPAILTSFDYEEIVAIGKNGVDSYVPVLGSNGSGIVALRAGTDTNGVGFLEFSSFAETPDTIGFANYALYFSIIYDWTS